jgi:hypothetical protein
MNVEHPILFNGEMVRAVRDGRKTQTRRPQVAGRRCPFGVPGDRLWVRETWFYDHIELAGREKPTPYSESLLYWRADGECCQQVPECLCAEVGSPWRPSIHMPRWASRLTLDVLAVRLEPVQAITPEGCMAEGLVSYHREHDAVCDLRDQFRALWDSIYANQRGGIYAWAANPMVWVGEFKRHEAAK